MIDKIHFRTSENLSGKKFDQIRIWIAGIPFHTDYSPYVASIMKRIANEGEIYIMDTRTQANESP